MAPKDLDDEVLTRVTERLERLERRALEGVARQAAVLVPLCTIDGAPAVLFTKRSEKVGTHKGQVSFPGGMSDDDDDGPVATALRELEEELGIAPASVRVLGLFHDARAITGVRVSPVVAYVGALDDLSLLTPSVDEIDDVFALTFEDIVDPSKRSIQTFGTRGPFPVFEAGPYPVWGLTAFILAEILAELFDETVVDTTEAVRIATGADLP